MYLYNYQYQLRSGNSHDVQYDNTTVLTATFLFGGQIPPSMRKEVRERCKTATRMIKDESGVSCQDLGPFNKYLKEHEGARFAGRDTLFGREYYRHRSQVTITPLLFRLGFKLREEAIGHLPLEEMINLNALNHFVLTGEYPNHEQQNQIRNLQEQQA